MKKKLAMILIVLLIGMSVLPTATVLAADTDEKPSTEQGDGTTNEGNTTTASYHWQSYN